MNDIDIYYGKRDIFYYAQIADKSVVRDNKISELLGDDVKKYYYNPTLKKTENIFCTRFWKDKKSIVRFSEGKDNIIILDIDRETFINIIPDIIPEDLNGFDKIQFYKNLKMKKEEANYKNLWKTLRSKYKATPIYRKVERPHSWLPCKNCGLIPIIWEFNNGRSTACGCGKDDYDHFSISAESILSYHTRTGTATGFDPNALQYNWNRWVVNGQNIFEEQKESYKNLDIKIW